MLIVAQHLPTLEEFKFPPCGSGRDDETANIRTATARDDSGENDCSPVAAHGAYIRPCLVGGKDSRRSEPKNRHGGGEKSAKQAGLIQCHMAGIETLQAARRARLNEVEEGIHSLGQRIF